MAYGVPLFAAQSITFHMSLPEVAHSISGGLFLQGPGGLVAVPLVQRYGRLPVLFWSQFLSAMMVMAAALSPNYACFTAFRALQGFVNSAPQVIGLSIIHDMLVYPLADLKQQLIMRADSSFMSERVGLTSGFCVLWVAQH